MTAKIVSVKIGPMPMHMFDPMPKVHAFFDNDTDEVLFKYYLDEISFTEKEFIGMTKEQALKLQYKKDIAYLQSDVKIVKIKR